MSAARCSVARRERASSSQIHPCGSGKLPVAWCVQTAPSKRSSPPGWVRTVSKVANHSEQLARMDEIDAGGALSALDGFQPGCACRWCARSR